MAAFSIIHSYADRMAIAKAQAQSQAKGNVEKPKSGGFLSWLAGYFPTLATFFGWTKQEIPKERQVGSTREVIVLREPGTIVPYNGKYLIVGKDGNAYLPMDFRKKYPELHRQKKKMQDVSYISLFSKSVGFHEKIEDARIFKKEEPHVDHKEAEPGRVISYNGKYLIVGRDGDAYLPEEFQKKFPVLHREKMNDAEYRALFFSKDDK